MGPHMTELFRYDAVSCGANVKKITYIPRRGWEVVFSQRKAFGFVIGLVWTGGEGSPPDNKVGVERSTRP